MTLEELYNQINGDYQDILARFSSEIMIDKFVKKFSTDLSFESLCNAIERNDWKEAFLAAHTLKGLCLNLSFTDLCAPVSKITEELRSGDKSPNNDTFEELKKKYFIVIKSINDYLNID